MQIRGKEKKKRLKNHNKHDDGTEIYEKKTPNIYLYYLDKSK